MTHDAEYYAYRVGGVLTTLMSILSIFGACFVIRKSYKNKKMDTEDRDFLVNDYVLYMSMWDLITHILTLFYWSQVGFNLHWVSHWPDSICSFCGFMIQLSIISAASWQICIAINLFRLMNGAPNDKLKMKTCCKIGKFKVLNIHLYIWIWSLLASFIPITHYGFTNNPESSEGFVKFECWINESGKEFTIILYIVLSIYIIISLVIFCYIACKKCNCISSDDNRTLPVQKILEAFTTICFIVYIFPTIERFYELYNAPWVGLVILHNIALGSIGFGNFIIWIYYYPKYVQQLNQQSLSSLQSNSSVGSYRMLMDHRYQGNNIQNNTINVC
eukprot:72244_1